MKTPPFLLSAALLFWGWETGFLVVGAIMAVVLEGARWVKARWEFSEEDFKRIWVFCTLLFLAAAIFAFTSNAGPGEYRSFLQNPSPSTSRGVSTSTGRSAASLFRWIPMLFFLFVAAPAYSAREGVPLRTISIILGWRWKRAKKLGLPPPPDRTVNISYPYFALCLFAASVHVDRTGAFFWGLCALLGWGMWPLRSRRFSLATWASILVLALGLGYTGRYGLERAQSYLSNLNPQWFSGPGGPRGTDVRESQTHIGLIGRLQMSGQIVIRVEGRKGPVPPLLREASYRTFKGRNAWDAEIAERDYQPVAAETNGTTFVLVRDKTNVADVSIGCYLDGGHGLLPVPTGCGRLENLTAYVVERNALGALMVREGPGLVVFDAWYGPGAGIDAPPDSNQDLAVPVHEIPALDQVVAEAGLDKLSPGGKLKALSSLFAQKFTYQIWQPPVRWFRTNETALTRFLLRSRSGHCEYFATAATLLLRRAHVPTRYAVGYAVHEGGHGKFVVRQRDAHAWCLVWDERSQSWRDYDPTPPSWISIEGERASPFQWLSDTWSRAVYEFSKFRWGQGHWRQYLLWALIPMLGVLLYQIVFRRRQRREPSPFCPEPVWPGLDSEFYQLERKLAERGLGRLPSEAVSTWVSRVIESPVPPEVQPLLEHISRLHYRYRFDPQGLNPEQRETLRREVVECMSSLTSVT